LRDLSGIPFTTDHEEADRAASASASAAPVPAAALQPAAQQQAPAVQPGLPKPSATGQLGPVTRSTWPGHEANLASLKHSSEATNIEASMHGSDESDRRPTRAKMGECMNGGRAGADQGGGWKYHFRASNFNGPTAIDATFDWLLADGCAELTERDRSDFHRFIVAVAAASKRRDADRIQRPGGFIRLHVVKRPGGWRYWLASIADGPGGVQK
jgi:hypothetical protein